jgi:hypothetical protein
VILPDSGHAHLTRIVTAPIPGVVVAIALLLGGCDGAPATASGFPSPSAPIPSAGSAGPSTPSTAPAGQTDTDWGRIWDALPPAFPVYPGAAPAEEAQTGPVSATFAVEAEEASAVAAWMQIELERAAYRTEALNGPLEDGSFVLESKGTADCRIEVVAAPLGSLTTVTIRYGAACPDPQT